VKLTQTSPEVFVAEGPISVIGPEDIAVLREALHKTPRKRVRINAHPDRDDPLHEMIIAISRNSYIRPHKHPSKSEAFHIVEGAVDIIIFDNDGEIAKVIPLSAPGSGKPFYYRMSEPFFHTLIIRSEYLVVHEITNGPYRVDGAVFADFAPRDDDSVGAAKYCAELERRVSLFLAGGK
jgi:cupin fold WbuC family metalloprotein